LSTGRSQAYRTHFFLPSIYYSGVHREGFLGAEWLGGGPDGQITSNTAIFKAILLPSGATSALSELFENLQMPFRHVIWFQVGCGLPPVSASCIPCPWRGGGGDTHQEELLARSVHCLHSRRLLRRSGRLS
jgi:hypothetical protein